MEERSYIAFISYRHKPLDKQAAEMIQKKIEHYKVPKEYRAQVGSDRLGMVFRDEDELPASSSLSDSITYALDHAKYLIVICTPDLPKSQWCEQEIRYFLQTHDRDHVLAVLVDGDPEESFSPLLRFDYDETGSVRAEIEPLAANIAGPNHTIDRKAFNKEIVRLYAAMIGCPFDALWQRERRYRTNRLLAAAGALVAAMAVFLGVVLTKNAQIQEQNAQITEQNAQITDQNRQISAQNLSLEEQKSTLMVDKGRMQLENDDIYGAIESGLSAAPASEGSPYDHRMGKLLADALGAYDYKNLRKREFVSYSNEVKDMICTEDALITVDTFGKVRCLDKESGSLRWESPAVTDDLATYSNYFSARLLWAAGTDRILCTTRSDVRAISLADGSTLWSYARETQSGAAFLSDDGSVIAFYDRGGDLIPDEYLEYFLIFLNTSDGSLADAVHLQEENFTISIGTTGEQWSIGGDFSDDGRYFSYNYFLLSTTSDENADESMKSHFVFAVFDRETDTNTRLGTFKDDHYISTALYGMQVSDDGADMDVTLYSAKFRSVLGVHYSANLPEGETPANWSERQETRQVQWYSAETSPRFVPALFSDDYGITFCEEHIYISSTKDAKLLNHRSMPSKIVWAGWADSEKSTFRMLLEDGRDWSITINPPGSEFLINREFYEPWTQTSSILLSVPAAEDTGMVFLTDSSDPGRIMKMYRNTDPSVAFAPQELEENTISYCRWALSPSGSRLFCVKVSYQDGLLLRAYDPETLEQTHEVAFPDVVYATNSQLLALDDNQVQLAHTRLSLDGTATVTEGVKEDDMKDFNLGPGVLHVLRLATGEVVLAGRENIPRGGSSIFDTFDLIHIWVDGVKQKHTLQVLSAEDFFLTGENGWLIGCGPQVTMDNRTRTWTWDEEERDYHLVNFLTGETKDIPNACPESRKRVAAAGREKPFFAVADTDGCLRLYHIDTGEVTLLSDSYDGGTVFNLTFTAHDNYLVVMGYNGVLELYDLQNGGKAFTEDGGRVFSESVSLYESFYEGGYLRAFTDEERNQLILIPSSTLGFAPMVTVDLNSMQVTGSTRDVVYCLPERHRILALRNKNLAYYPIYTDEELLAWAKESLAEKGE